jgi:hypothetical protein
MYQPDLLLLSIAVTHNIEVFTVMYRSYCNNHAYYVRLLYMFSARIKLIVIEYEYLFTCLQSDTWSA